MFLFTLLLITSNIILSNNEKLIFVETLSRHGARAPIKLNDTGYDLMNIKWTTPGELTPIGKRMEYLLGLYNRQRYITGKYNFLSKKYDPHELIVYSSDINRTLLSITSQLQGLYPMSPEYGDKLEPEQYNVSFPPFNISYENFSEEIKLLNDSALPDYMTIIPIHFISLKNTTTECAEKVDLINKENANNKKNVFNFIEEFNNKYSEILNTFYHRKKDLKFEFSMINAIFDAIIADTTEGKDISRFFKANNIDINDFYEKRFEVAKMFFRDFVFGDDDNKVILFYNTPLLKIMINYMKRKIEDDINDNQSVKNVSDYSRPKMVIISGHDTTLSAQELFFIKFFNLSLEKYEYPTFTSQISFEITRDDDEVLKEKNISLNSLNYSDYNIFYYFNDKLMLKTTFDKFAQIIENKIWNSEKMDNFCFGDKKENIEISLIIIVFMGFLILILSIALIVLIAKVRKKDDNLLDSFKQDKDNKLLNNDNEE